MNLEICRWDGMDLTLVDAIKGFEDWKIFVKQHLWSPMLREKGSRYDRENILWRLLPWLTLNSQSEVHAPCLCSDE